MNKKAGVIAVIIIAAIIGGAAYFWSTGQEVAKSAEFEVTNLSLSKSEVEPGETTTVSVMVKNTGGKEGTHTVELSIDGKTKTENVTLGPGASDTAEFNVSMEEEGTYQVSVEDLSGSFEVVKPEEEKPPTADFTYSPSSPSVGENVTFDPSGSEFNYASGGWENLRWEFGDGGHYSTSYSKSVNHSYSSPGDYDVTLTVVRNDYQTDNITKTVTVVPIVCKNVQVSENVVDPDEPVTVSTTVRNIGTELAFKWIGLYVDGEKVNKLPVTVSAGESRERTSSLKLYKEGDRSVTIDEATPVTVTVRHKSAEFEYGDLEVARENSTITASIPIKNIGSVDGTEKVEFYVDGNFAKSRPVALAPGEEKTVSFKHKFVESGIHGVRVGKMNPKKVEIPGVLGLPFATRVLSLSFDERSDSKVYDASGHGNDGTIVGDPKFVNGKFGKALSFDGTDDCVKVPDDPSLDLTDAITIAFWSYKPSSGVHGSDLWKGGGFGAPGYCAWHLDDETMRVEFQKGENKETGAYARFDIPVPTDEWFHFAVTWDYTEGTMRSYVNGKFKQSATFDSKLGTYDKPLSLGYNSFKDGYYFDGKLDEVRIYNRALTEAEIERLYENKMLLKKGTHTTKWQYFGENVLWDNLNARTDISGKGEITTIVQVSNDNGKTVKDNIVVPLVDESKSYDLSGLKNAKYARIKTKFSKKAMLDHYTLTGHTPNKVVKKSWEFASDWKKGRIGDLMIFVKLPRNSRRT